MKTGKKFVNMLIIEEQMIVGVDLKRHLQKQGYSVVFGKTIEDIVMVMEKKVWDIVITSPGLLVKNEKKNGSMIYRYIEGIMACAQMTQDTLIMDSDPETIRRFPKPYDSLDVVNYVAGHFMRKKRGSA